MNKNERLFRLIDEQASRKGVHAPDDVDITACATEHHTAETVELLKLMIDNAAEESRQQHIRFMIDIGFSSFMLMFSIIAAIGTIIALLR